MMMIMKNIWCYHYRQGFSSKNHLASHFRRFHVYLGRRCYLCDDICLERFINLTTIRQQWFIQRLPFITFDFVRTVYSMPCPSSDNNSGLDPNLDLVYTSDSNTDCHTTYPYILSIFLESLTKIKQLLLQELVEPEVEVLEPPKKEEVSVRFYVHRTILGYKRSKSNQKSNQYSNTPLIQIDGVKMKQDVTWYVGKRMVYIYKIEKKKNGSHYQCIWGKVTWHHGKNDIV
ncbi:hypothetical protein LWI29_019231 [Acer saccharum]|uniref:Uncharacterized protein n=1 Tax=Acer saccharum TaxID=4024 RepID=A0AA39SZ55_ACESA|nr:hypothetical protein LWI29_019231 [Acer saccharum]